MKKVLALLMSCSLLLIGCKHDDVLENDQYLRHEENGLKGKSFVVTQTELEAKYAGNKSLNSILQKEFKTESGLIKTNSVEEEAAYGVYIDLDNVAVFESDQMHTITYNVTLEEQEETDEVQEVYNLMYFSHDYQTYYVTLLRYDFSQISFKEFVMNPDIFRAQLAFLPLNDIENIYQNIRYSFSNVNQAAGKTAYNYELPVGLQRLQDQPCAVTTNYPGQVCKGSGEVKHVHGENCSMSGSDRATPGYTVIDTRPCYGEPGSSAPGGGGGGSVGSPGGGGGGGGSTPANPNPSPIKSIPIKIKEILDLIRIQINQEQKETNADWIKKMDLNQDFVTKLNELKSASTSSYESAYTMFNNAVSGIQFSPKYTGNPNDIASGGQVALQTSISSMLSPLNCIGFMHCHKNDGSTYKTFSFSDIEAFSRLATISTQSQQQLALYLTTVSGGTYVMKMTNKTKMIAFFNYVAPDHVFNTFDIALDVKIDKKSDKDKQTLEFLKFIDREMMLKDLGLEIYEKNNSGNWEKLTLSSNKKNIVRTGI